MGKHEPGKHEGGGNRVPDTRNYSGKHGKGCFVMILGGLFIALGTAAGGVYSAVTLFM